MAGLPIPGYSQPGFFGQLGGGNQALNLLLALVQQQQGAQNEARQANESRYQDILKLFGDNRQRDLSSLDTFGQSLIDDANKTYTDKRNNLITDLAERGLSGSTKRIAVEDATQREKDATVNRIKDMISQERRQDDLGFTDRAAGVMERRSDPYPNAGNLAGLVSQLSNVAAGQGGGGPIPQPGNLNATVSPTGQAVAMSPTDQVIAQRAAKKASQDASAAEQARLNAMGVLTNAMHTGGIEGEDRTRQALAMLQQNGWATQNYNQGVPTINFGRTPQPSYVPPAAGYSRPPAPPRYSNQDYLDRLQATHQATLAAGIGSRQRTAAHNALGALSMFPLPWQGANVRSVGYSYPADRPPFELFGG